MNDRSGSSHSIGEFKFTSFSDLTGLFRDRGI